MNSSHVPYDVQAYLIYLERELAQASEDGDADKVIRCKRILEEAYSEVDEFKVRMGSSLCY